MRKRLTVTAIVLSMTAAFAAVALAQEPPPPIGNQGQQMPNMAAFKALQEQTKYTRLLQSMVRHIGEINRDPKYTLTPQQAKKVLGVLKPLRVKPKLTQDGAKLALKQLKPIFTAAQLNAMARIKDRRPGMRQGFGGPGMSKMGPGGPGTAGPGFGKMGPGMGKMGPGAGKNGQFPKFDPSRLKDMNPFYVDKSAKDPWAKMRNQRWDYLFKGLEVRAKGGAVSSIPEPPQGPGFPKGPQPPAPAK